MSIPYQHLEARQDGSALDNRLAIFGGTPIRYRQWPKWPRADATTQRNVLDVLHSTKWTISGLSERTRSYEGRFAEAFAVYCGAQFCVPCGNGTAALTIALQALGVGPGDEVIVPGLTWVACASAVCHVGAVPIIADVDPKTLCISPETIQPHLSSRTAAIMVVHLYSALAPIGRINELAARAGIPVLEDASQAHGARIGNRRTGTFGEISAFSMQQSKLLAAGEGGACVTDDPDFYRRMQQFRADGRGLPGSARGEPYQEIVPHGEVLGRNLCMSEFHAAILLDALGRLDAENEHRHGNFRLLVESLGDIPGVSVVAGPETEMQTHYRVCLRLDSGLLDQLPVEVLARALTEELSLPVEPAYAPLNANPLYQPLLSPHIGRLSRATELYDPSRFELPVAAEAARTCITLPHQCLLGDRSDLEDIAHALQKVLEHRESLASVDPASLRRMPFRGGYGA